MSSFLPSLTVYFFSCRQKIKFQLYWGRTYDPSVCKPDQQGKPRSKSSAEMFAYFAENFKLTVQQVILTFSKLIRGRIFSQAGQKVPYSCSMYVVP